MRRNGPRWRTSAFTFAYRRRNARLRPAHVLVAIGVVSGLVVSLLYALNDSGNALASAVALGGLTALLVTGGGWLALRLAPATVANKVDALFDGMNRRLRASASRLLRQAADDGLPATVANLKDRRSAGFDSAVRRALDELAVDRSASPHVRAATLRLSAQFSREDGYPVRGVRSLEEALVVHPRAGRSNAFTLELARCLYEAGRPGDARSLLEDTVAGGSSDVVLAYANTLAHDPAHDHDRLTLINKVLHRANVAGLTKLDQGRPLALDNIASTYEQKPDESGPLVSVIVPVRNGRSTLEASLRSLTHQTHANLQVIVVDDASDDETPRILDLIARTDDRIVVHRLKRHSGPYAARNAGLRIAQGVFVTVHDADDWSVPERVELQVRALIQSDHQANFSCWVRCGDRLEVLSEVRRASPSLLFRRELLDQVGPWDELLANADDEFARRITATFGPASIDTVAPGVPLTFAAWSRTSLTRDPQLGLHSLTHAQGARRHHNEASAAWHASPGFRATLPLDPGAPRLFPVPDVLLRRDASPAVTSVDVVILSDFALSGGNVRACLNEAEALIGEGHSVALAHHPRASRRARVPINPKVWAFLLSRGIRMLTLDDDVRCRLLLAVHPPMGEVLLDRMAQIRPERTVLLVNQLPFNLYDGKGPVVGQEPFYRLANVIENLEARFGLPPLVAPLSPVVRSHLNQFHGDELSGSELSDADWLVCMGSHVKRRPTRPVANGTIRLGRHTRDDVEKWPESRHDLLGAYPPAQGFEIRVLGGAEVPRGILGRLPANWKVTPFDGVGVDQFLASLDVYAYFTHSRWIEAFGLSPLEAIVAGVPVIADQRFAEVFHDAAMYVDPSGVADHALRLAREPAHYEEVVSNASRFAQSRFSGSAHVARMQAIADVSFG